MGIHNAKAGEIVYCAFGHGSKAEVLERLDYSHVRSVRAIYYRVKILDDSGLLQIGTQVDLRSTTLTRRPKTSIPDNKRFGLASES